MYNGAETQGCDCWTCIKVSIKNNLFLHDGDLEVKIIWKKQFSNNLPQGGMEVPALYVLKFTKLVMHSKLPGLASDAMKTYSDALEKLETKDKLKKKNSK